MPVPEFEGHTVLTERHQVNLNPFLQAASSTKTCQTRLAGYRGACNVCGMKLLKDKAILLNM